MTISDLEIDKAILAVVQPTWRKVALIVSQAAKRNRDFADTEECYYITAARIKALVADGRLLAQGDLSKWRNSEVRLP